MTLHVSKFLQQLQYSSKKYIQMIFQPICPSRFNQRDAYETSYNESHRPFSQHERRAAAHWENKDQRERQWLRDPITSKKLQMRVPIPPSSVTKSKTSYSMFDLYQIFICLIFYI